MNAKKYPLLLLLCFAPLALGLTACDSPGEKLYDQSKLKKEQADDSTGEQRVQLYLEAIDLLKQAIQLEPENPKFHEKLAACYKNIEKYPDSITTYNKAIELDPDESKNYYKLMGVYIRSKKYDEAQALYDRAKELDVIKRDPRAVLHLDEQYAELQRVKTALDAGQQPEPKDVGSDADD